MKKIFVFLVIVLIVITVAGFKYVSCKVEYDAIIKANAEYEQYKEKEIYGIDVATLINKTVDKNTKNNIEKNDNGIFIQNDTNSIEIELYMADNDKTYKMEMFYNAGTEQLVQYYGNVKFKCSKIEYHEKTKRVKYILFEQIINS